MSCIVSLDTLVCGTKGNDFRSEIGGLFSLGKAETCCQGFSYSIKPLIQSLSQSNVRLFILYFHA
jgi:hypothetical protein